jgi:hypothetical protein
MEEKNIFHENPVEVRSFDGIKGITFMMDYRKTFSNEAKNTVSASPIKCGSAVKIFKSWRLTS